MLLTPILDVVVVTYHRPSLVSACLNSLCATLTPIHVVDNSCGAIDDTFNQFNQHELVVYRCKSNVGKSGGINQWYQANRNRLYGTHLVVIDGDISAPTNWAIELQEAIIKFKDFTILVPLIKNRESDSFLDQLLRGHFSMHGPVGKLTSDKAPIVRTHVAGPMLCIERRFFDKIGGYGKSSIYGDDDGWLCRQAVRLKRKCGILTSFMIDHLGRFDEVGYKRWKQNNANIKVDHRGYYDQSQNRNNID